MDVFGEALKDQFIKPPAETLWVHNSYDEPEEMPVDIYFRNENEMPELELKALDLCRGKVLDVGAGVGSHALILQKRGINVCGMDISAAAVSIMKQRGLKQAIEGNILTYRLPEGSSKYDTLLFMMNGIGLTGSVAGLKSFLQEVKKLINKDGQLVFDSSDLSYLYLEIPFPEKGYFGEVSFRYEYKSLKGNWFKWIYVDQQTLTELATQTGWHTDIIFEDDSDQYLARLTLA
ncbi:class I SAM-dependent methyltransferase [Pedobacter heparinus]|uniref:Methyltransferase type 11 n=1 Tax=Pedobacter heparinus (strain ATCC 13125 / DSM 2366 / CIP 104194 / JCM 7457 / NBRC 12017 / NCIMB 9290 / NRRL B-14731 / HIM 762-3) TaxID=485917 RepID=C6XY61_PEDHD|nr:class I SAM-dependent methyltransferase [Pedobacter heparinus]ACU02328.1 Methyltransferase type 11 [Pedobacter heparinus DSM 2366]